MSSDPGRDDRLPRVLGGVELSAEEAAANEWVRQAQDAQLTTARELARQWGATVTALTGLFGLGTLVGADTAVRALEPGWRAAYGVCVLAALGAAALSITWAALASQATVTIVGPTAADRIRAHRDRVDRALEGVTRSRFAAACALAAGAAAIGVRWFAPT